VRSDGRAWSVVRDWPLDAFARERLAASARELEDERAMVAGLLPAAAG